jgi:hypothetical protein
MHAFILTGREQLHQFFTIHAHLITETVRHENGDDLFVQILVHREGNAHGFIGGAEMIRKLIHGAFLPDEVILNENGLSSFVCAAIIPQDQRLHKNDLFPEKKEPG